MKSSLPALGGGIIAAVAGLVLARIYLQHKTAARIKITSPAGIASLEKVRLGGVDQWIQIRGDDRTKPILLFLHSGPGFPEMPFSHVNAALEKEFVVVQWDQRGAGKSYSSSIPESSMTIEQFIADTHDLVELLLKRFGARKLIPRRPFVGLDRRRAPVVAIHPELFDAYVGISQAANAPESERMMYRFALELAEKGTKGPRRGAKRKSACRPTEHARLPQDEELGSSFPRRGLFGNQPMEIRAAFASPASLYSWGDLLRDTVRGDALFVFPISGSEAFLPDGLVQTSPEAGCPGLFFSRTARSHRHDISGHGRALFSGARCAARQRADLVRKL